MVYSDNTRANMSCGMPPPAEAHGCYKKRKPRNRASRAYDVLAADAAESARTMPSTVLLCSIAAAIILGMPSINSGPLAVQNRFAAAAVVFVVIQMIIRIVTTSEPFLIPILGLHGVIPPDQVPF